MIPLPPHVVIGFLVNHTKDVIEYINDVKDASKDQKNLSDELATTQTVLAQLNSHADDDDWKETMATLCAAGGPFDQLSVELKSMEKKLKAATGKFGKTGKALMWHFTKDGVKKHFDRIERIKTLLQLAVQNNHRSVPPKSRLISESSPRHFKRTWFALKRCSKVRIR
jgi:uncharacterized protein YabN with tetrapyrrole methylase and pyrophosphatase domain